ncbi:endophilin-A3-like isoform X2 [Ruditapes philippinarum]|uniref:endophilin-A3-like isoform X2 n=1 Tax=Ruditapes philippinarum TaxID=129788 RepID=UPI00295B782C|nr:endophilin-A3-like isoform X2 [Ruditapes philippinarum]
MSLAGFKKQLNKANQFMSEKIGGAKGTELDDEFCEMERKIDVMGKMVEDLITKTHEFLQPNPASRAKLSAMGSFQKIRGQAKSTLYPQPEGVLGEHMQKHGQDMGEDSLFGQSLVDAGESFKRLAEVKYSLEENVKQNFLEPWTHLQTKDLKEVNHHRKKLSGRRLDFDCKRRKKEKGSTITDEDLRLAEEKFEESKQLAETAMYNLLENDVEQIAQLQSFIEAQTEYHRQALDILQDLGETIESRRNEAANRPKSDHIPKRVGSFKRSPSPYDDSDSGSYNFNSAPAYATNSRPAKKDPCAEALYDFEPENEGELGFQEGDIITLITQIDDNWFEGKVNGVTGYFPINYVKVVVPLP